jgi:Flp pilus assembly protein TadB
LFSSCQKIAQASEGPNHLVESEHSDYLAIALRMAGLSIGTKPVFLWWLFSAVVVGVISSTLYSLNGLPALAPWSFMLGFIVATIGFGLWLAITAARHQSVLAKQLPSALDLMASMLEAGSPVPECIIFLGENSPNPIRVEFNRCAVLLRNGNPVRDAIAELAHYFHGSEIKAFVDAINLSWSGGGSLARDVRNIASDMRGKHSAAGGANITAAQVNLILLVFAVLFSISTLQTVFVPASGTGLLQSTFPRIILVVSFFAAISSGAVLAMPKQSGPALKRFKTILLGDNSRWKVSHQLRNELPGFLDRIIMLTESGISLPQAVAQVRSQSSASCPTLCRELETTINNLTSFKSAIPNAFKKMGEEYQVQELVHLGAALDAAERTGSSVGYQLKEQGGALRSHLKLSRQTRKTKVMYVVFVILLAIAGYLILF